MTTYKLTVTYKGRSKPIVVTFGDLDTAEHRYARYRWDNKCLAVTLHSNGQLLKSWEERGHGGQH